MPRLTPEAKQYIKTHPNISDRKLQGKILEIYGVGVSHTAIWNYKKSLQKVSKVDKVNTKVDIKTSLSGGREKNGRGKKTKELIEKVENFTMVVSCLHVNAHKLQKEQIEKIVGSCDVKSVREFLLTEFREALTN